MRSRHPQILTSWFRVRLRPARGILIGSIALLLLCGRMRSQENVSQKVRLAEGEYRVYKQSNAGGIGPFAPGVFNFSESWTLWRQRDGSLEVEGERDYESPSDDPHHNKFTVRLSRDFRILSVQEFRKLVWRQDSGPLDCNFLPGTIHCTSNAVNPANAVHLDLPLREPYGLLWPISAFSLSHITRFVGRTTESAIPVQMISVDEQSREDPVSATILAGHLAYLGHESITIADRKWEADKFELRVPLHAPFLLWTSPAGLLLDFVEEDNRGRLKEQGMKLVRYQQWLAF